MVTPGARVMSRSVAHVVALTWVGVGVPGGATETQ
jgi:hypothetical protein